MPAKSSVFSSLLKVLGALAVSGSVFWFIYSSLGPVEVPPPPPSRSALRFDPQADMRQNKVFGQLSAIVKDLDLKANEVGRPNPFMRVVKAPPPAMASSTTSTLPTAVATSTAVTASTTPDMPATAAPQP